MKHQDIADILNELKKNLLSIDSDTPIKQSLEQQHKYLLDTEVKLYQFINQRQWKEQLIRFIIGTVFFLIGAAMGVYIGLGVRI